MLSREDITTLLDNRSPAAQLALIEHVVARYYANDDKAFASAENAVAEGMLTLLMQHAEVEVRTVLAASLCTSNKLPHILALKMAEDVSEVAVSILEHSPVFQDSDLLSFIRLDNAIEKLEAIARRSEISVSVSNALIATRIPSVVQNVICNEDADISDPIYQTIIEQHQENRSIIASFFQRIRVPSGILKSLIQRLSESMRASLEQQFGNLDEQQELQSLLHKSIERTTLRLLGFQSTDVQLMHSLRLLEGSRKHMLFLALGMAKMEIVELCLARVLCVPLRNIRRLLADENGVRGVYEAAELPEYLFEATQVTLRAIQALEKASIVKCGDTRLCTPRDVRLCIEDQELENLPGMEYIFALLQKNSPEDFYDE